MKRKLAIIGILLIFFSGVGMLVYPLVTSVVNNIDSRGKAEIYLNEAKQMKNTKIDRLFKEADDYNHSLTSTIILTDPFDASAYEKVGAHYKETFNAGKDGLIAYIDIPKIDTYLPIYHGTSSKILDKGAGHLENTALPIGGRSTHSVISAHSNYPGETFFNYLTDLRKGDYFYIHVLDRTLKYKVDQIKVVLPEVTEDLYTVQGKDYVTLMTCTPFGVNTHRLLVRGERVKTNEKKREVSSVKVVDEGEIVRGFYFAGYKIPYLTAWLVLGGFILVVASLTAFSVIGARRRSKKASKEVKEDA